MPDLNSTLRVSPLFEMLEDLHNGSDSMKRLLTNEWYVNHLQVAHNNNQEVCRRMCGHAHVWDLSCVVALPDCSLVGWQCPLHAKPRGGSLTDV